VAGYLLQLTYDVSINAVDKTYLIELGRDVSPFWDQREKKLPQQRSHAEAMG